MSSVSAFEAKTRFGALLERVAQGEEIVITRHEKPVARLVPEGRPRQTSVRQAVATLRKLSKELSGKSQVSFEEFKAARGLGRK